MIAYIKGDVTEVDEGRVILDVHDIGYEIYVSAREITSLPPIGTKVGMHTYLHVKEDLMQLYGFRLKEDLSIFKLLLGVNGIGPKAALGILSALQADELRFAILADDPKSIAQAPGIGIKTAKKLILELKDKLNLEAAFHPENSPEAAAVPGGMNDMKAEAVQALIALGYSHADALRAVKAADIRPNMNTEEILKAALKNMSFL